MKFAVQLPHFLDCRASEFFENTLYLEKIKNQYPEGTRIELIEMGDDPNPIPSGTKGTVLFVDDIGTVHVKFDNGRQLGLIVGEDSWREI